MDPRATPGNASDLAAGAPPLASHATFLRTLARGLLFDKSAAGDVAQRALLLALQRERSRDPAATRPPADPKSLRAWLAGVVRNLALQSGREERRRAERERAAATTEATSSAADEVARLELMERLLAAVRRLEPTYRATVMLRFFDQLKPGAIAKRTGVPVETVRTRLRRGLERLRVDLDLRHGGDRAAWGLALLPTALPAGGGILGGVVGTVTGSVALHALAVGGLGALAMSSKIKLAIGGLLAVAATAVIVEFARNDGAPQRPPREPSQQVALAPPAEATAAPAPADAAATAAQRAPEPPAPGASDVTGPFVVRGRTLNFAGQALGHLHVKLARFDGYETDGKPEATAVVESDGNGNFAWGLPLPRGTVTLTAAVAEPGWFGYSANELLFAGDPPRPLDLNFHALDTDVVGRVTGEGDRPLGDAIVKTWNGSADECDENGEYRLHAPSTLGELWVSVSAPGHVGVDEVVALRGTTRDRPATANFRLRPGGTATGRVVDESGVPVASAAVSTWHAWLGDATTGSDGRYAITGIDLQRPQYTLEVSHPDFARAIATVSPSGGSVGQDFVLQRGATVSGFAFDADGKPARGASVWVGGHARLAGTPHRLAHDDGSFTFTHVNLGAQKAGAELKGRPSIEVAITVPAEPPRLDGVELRFTAGHSLAGRVEDASGKPIAGANVLTRRNPSDYDVYTKSDATGRFELHGVPKETLQVDAYAQGFESRTMTAFTLDRDDLVIVMSGAGRLAGTVVDAATGEPIESFRIRLVEPHLEAGERQGFNYEASWRKPGRTFLKTRGKWSTAGESLPRGTVFGVEASAEGFAPAFALHVVATESPDPAALVLSLGRGASVVGTVVDDAGAPVAGAVVRLFVGNPPSRGGMDGDVDDPRWSVRTSDIGAFAIEGASAGEGWLLVMAAEFPAHQEGPFDVPPGGSAPPRKVRLERGGAIEGVALDGAGRPKANRTILLFDVRDAGTGAPPVSALTDSDGRFRFTGLRPGSLQVSLVAQHVVQSVNEMSARVTVAAGATATVRLEPKGDARVRGRVVGELDAIEEVTIQLHWLGPADSQGPPEEAADGMLCDRGLFAVDGAFDVQSLQAGRYTVAASGRGKNQTGFWYGQAEVTVAAGGDADVTVKLARSR